MEDPHRNQIIAFLIGKEGLGGVEGVTVPRGGKSGTKYNSTLGA